MKKSNIIKLVVVLCVMFTTLVINDNVLAGKFLTILGPSSVSPNQTFSVTVKTANCTGLYSMTGQGEVLITENATRTYTYTAPSSGSMSITISTSEVYELVGSGPQVNESATLQVTVKQPTPPPTTPPTTTKPTTPPSGGNSGGSSNEGNEEKPEDTRSTNNNLSSLSVEGVELTPVFNKDVTTYSGTAIDKTNVTIVATAEDTKSKVNGTGVKDLIPGQNSFVVEVVAENESVKKYTININSEVKPTEFVGFGDKELGVSKDTTGVTPPTGFEETSVTIDGVDVKAWKSELLDTTLLYLVDTEGNKNFYMYNGKEITSVFRPLVILGRNLYIIGIDKDKQVREGFKFGDVTVDGNQIKGWTFIDKELKDYLVFQVMDDTGKIVEFLYHSSSNTMVPYTKLAPTSISNYQKIVEESKTNESYFMISTALAGILAVTTTALGVMLYNKKRLTK